MNQKFSKSTDYKGVIGAECSSRLRNRPARLALIHTWTLGISRGGGAAPQSYPKFNGSRARVSQYLYLPTPHVAAAHLAFALEHAAPRRERGRRCTPLPWDLFLGRIRSNFCWYDAPPKQVFGDFLKRALIDVIFKSRTLLVVQ